MQRSRLIAELVVDVDNDPIANSGFDAWDGPFSVDSDDGSVSQTIRVSRDPADNEVVCTQFSFDAEQEEATPYVDEVGEREGHCALYGIVFELC